MRVAIVHDYLNQYGGAEKVLESWLEMYPNADIYTSIYIPKNFESSIQITKVATQNKIFTTWLQSLFKSKWVLKYFKHLFWLYPIVMSFVVVKDYDLVLISSTFCSKNIKLKNCKKIIHYCHSPVRFLHGLVTETDHKSLNPVFRSVIPLFTFWLKWMDLRAATYLTQKGAIWVGNSKFISSLILQVYKVNALVIYPPVELKKFLKIQRNNIENTKKSFYLCHGRISFHKRLDLAILACLELVRPLKISGGSALEKEMLTLKQIVSDFELKNPEHTGLIEFLGKTTDEQFFELLQSCQAFLFPGREDAGITPIEVFASGTPVLAYQAGGALEYVEDGVNGLFFPEQSVESLKVAILKFEEAQSNFKPEIIKETSQTFSSEVFKANFYELIN
jgi:glycosyltransferase involved in cell wall biosynthesis